MKIKEDPNILNTKIAKWCGFEWHEKKEFVHGPMMHGGRWESGHWDFNGKCSYELLFGYQGHYGEKQLPNFLESMDAILNWVVPKFREKGLAVQFYSAGNFNGYSITITYPGREDKGLYTSDAGKTMAEGFCLALEKYIDQ